MYNKKRLSEQFFCSFSLPFFCHCSLFICWLCLHIAYALLYIMFNIQMLSRKYIFAQLQCATTTTTSKMCVFPFLFRCVTSSISLMMVRERERTLFFLSLSSSFGILPKERWTIKSQKKSARSSWQKQKTCIKLTHTRTHEQFSRNVYLVNKFCIKREICVLWWRKERTTKTDFETVVRWGKMVRLGKGLGERNRSWETERKIACEMFITRCCTSFRLSFVQAVNYQWDEMAQWQ